MPGSVAGSTRLEEIEQKYDVVLNFPNLELHSAAAEGNVGLVHYALTHGQPVNSVLHGVQPIHAAAAGGSVSALKMLIDRGADVNAPRLPKRYNNEKKKGAPSLGAAGATPMHFAAANGHADIVQILLTCGAVPNKSDKLGQTPASLAEANGHDDVLHVLKVYDHLRKQDSAAETASIASGSILAGPFSDAGSVYEEESRPTMKERSMSMASNRSDASGILKLRKSLDGILGRRSRKNSVEIPPVPPLLSPRIDIEAAEDIIPDTSDDLPYPPSLTPSSVYHSPMGSNTASINNEEDTAPELPRIQESANPQDLTRVLSGESQGSTISATTFSSLRLAPPPRERRASQTSRRPSLPSILEKAAHPGQAFRNALHRREAEQDRFTPDAERSASGSSFFGRGRQPQNLNQDKTRKYMSRNAFIGLFRRSNSPPSRSPSPPKRMERPIDAQELEEGMERFKRASMEMDRQERQVTAEETRPASAPAIKTRFFEDLSSTGPTIPISAFTNRTSPTGAGERPWNRPRKGSNVIAPSPLANEWARESSDSDSTTPTGIRRTKTEGAREVGPSRLSQSSGPGSLRATKQRSATLPSIASLHALSGPRNASSSRLVDLAAEARKTLDARKDLRSGILRRQSEKKREETGNDAEDEDEEEVFHDALDVEPSDDIEVLAKTPEIESEPLPEDSKLSPPSALRFRGASIGSMNSQSSRWSTPSSVRFNPSDEGSDRPRTTPDNRPRGISVSSMATTTSSGVGFSSFNQSASATSLTPPSTLSITLGAGFPPVPEDDVPPTPQRKFSSRAEAAKAIKQQEDDMLQLAQLPLNATSSRDLAAQLAAYGESHVMEQELAQIERRERKYARRGKFEIPDDTGSEISSSFVSANSASASAPSVSSGVRSVISKQSAPPSLLSVEAPKSNVPNINTIYDRRATLYREKMQALTTAPPVHRSGPRQRSVTDGVPPGPPAWLTQSSGSQRGREISASLPAGSLDVQTPQIPKVRSRKTSFTSVRLPSAPAPPIADIVNTRYQGMTGHRSPSTAIYSTTSRIGSIRYTSSPQPSSSSQIIPPAPPVSIFSHRYAGPHDGGESDDSEGEQKGYTMVENDWGRKMLATGDTEGLARKGKWGFRAPFKKK